MLRALLVYALQNRAPPAKVNLLRHLLKLVVATGALVFVGTTVANSGAFADRTGTTQSVSALPTVTSHDANASTAGRSERDNRSTAQNASLATPAVQSPSVSDAALPDGSSRGTMVVLAALACIAFMTMRRSQR
jgi:hypothetical protein